MSLQKSVLEVIINSVTSLLASTFGSDYSIYIDERDQGFNRPAIFVFATKSNQNLSIMGIRDDSYLLEVIFYPEDKKTPNIGLIEANEVLQDNLRVITLTNGDKIRGVGINSVYNDGALHFFIEYRVRWYTSTADQPKMESFGQNISLADKDG